MALVVEDGTGLSNANSFVSVSELDAYHTDRGNTDIVSSTSKEALLINATDYLKIMYEWDSTLLTLNQSLPFPRVTHGLPYAIKEATMILAQKAHTKELISDEDRRVIKEKVSSLEVQYDSNDTQVGTRYTAVEALISPYLKNNASSFERKAFR